MRIQFYNPDHQNTVKSINTDYIISTQLCSVPNNLEGRVETDFKINVAGEEPFIIRGTPGLVQCFETLQAFLDDVGDGRSLEKYRDPKTQHVLSAFIQNVSDIMLSSAATPKPATSLPLIAPRPVPA